MKEWDSILETLSKKLGKSVVDSWFVNLDFELDGSLLRIYAANKFSFDWISTHYLDVVEKAASQIGLSVNFSIRQKSVSKTKNKVDPYSLPLDKEMRFDTFVRGSSNEMAFTSSLRVAESLGKDMHFNPLFLYGPVGLGKTHLMNSIGWYVRNNYTDKSICYLSAEQFMLKFINALKNGNMMIFKEDLRSFDVLMIDDFQFLSGKESTQEEFFHTFVYLITQGKQLVISADKAPSELSGIEERLRSRLGSGLVVNIHPANYELRFSILKEKAIGINISDEILQFIAENVKNSIRELGGALRRVIAYVDLFNKDLDLDTVKGILKEFVKEKTIITSDMIIDAICLHYKLAKEDLCSKSRKKEILKPRQIAMYLCRELTDSSLPDIGRLLGGKDHTTALYSIRKVEMDLKKEDKIITEVNKIKNMIV
ncbi:MAG: chromosomal replication initiator protein DnaA [Alphaproteobacteria bacterium]|nr:MAG: chromosomal replication initiator protein DnaA [Alphaproteobacteria bacterium]